MAQRDIVVVGASAGGVQAVTDLLAQLPGDLRASLFLVIHIPAEHPSRLPQILGKITLLPVRHPTHSEPIRRGVIYVAPPDHHLAIGKEGILLGRGPRENGHRPAIDPLFRSAAETFGRRVIGVVLSGMMDDGTAGLGWIHRNGGITVAQDPSEALFPDMPESAIRNVPVDHVVPIARMAQLLPTLVRDGVPLEAIVMKVESDRSQPETAVEGGNRPSRAGQLAEKHGVYTCPDCAGALWEVDAGEKLVRYECRVGHAYSPETLLENQAEILEAAFWTVLRSLEENASFLRRARARSLDLRQLRATSYLDRQIQIAERRIDLVRHVLSGKEFSVGPRPEKPAEEPVMREEEPTAAP